MKQKEKGWIWKLTGPFASENYTIVFGTIFYPKGYPPPMSVVNHEYCHQQQAVRLFSKRNVKETPSVFNWLVWYWLYLVGFPLGLPFLWNPWRWKWEKEAYMKGSGYDFQTTRDLLESASYGWLIVHKGGKENV